MAICNYGSGSLGVAGSDASCSNFVNSQTDLCMNLTFCLHVCLNCFLKSGAVPARYCDS